MKLLGYIVVPLTLICLLAMSVSDAEARRLGGGRSFGSKPSFSKTFKKPTTPFSSSKKATSSKQGGFARPGMGLFGGLLAGTFLGSMLGMGGGMGGGFFNILIIGFLIYLGIKFVKSKNNSRYRNGDYDNYQQGNYRQQQSYQKPQQQSGGAWDNLSTASSSQTEQPDINIPSDFDENEFLEGAKAVYSRLQAAWDARNMDEIASFATADVVSEIRKQAEEDPNPSKTEILMLNARVLEVKQQGDRTLATVYYDTLLREDSNKEQPDQVREVWHFEKQGSNGMWKLDGIQQLED